MTLDTLTRKQLTAALAARQMLVERERVDPAEAIRRLTPLQAQHATAPHIALAARIEDFDRDHLHAAIDPRAVVKATLMRVTLHLASADDYPAYAQLTRQAWLRSWRNRYPHLDEEEITEELRAWFSEPRTNVEIRERVRRYEGVDDEDWAPVIFARTLLPLLQLAPAGYWRPGGRPVFVVDPRPLPDPLDAATLVLGRYLAAFGPASRRDLAAWAGVAQRDFAGAWERVETVTYRDEEGRELFDLPGQPLPPASTRLPVRFLGRWEQPLLAYADRDRIMSPEVQALKLTLSGDQTVTVDGRVAASWLLKRSGNAVRVEVTPHVEIRRSARAEIRAEAERTARFVEAKSEKVEVVGV